MARTFDIREVDLTLISSPDFFSWTFLVLSGMGTGLSWLFFFAALKSGPISGVAPIDGVPRAERARQGVDDAGCRVDRGCSPVDDTDGSRMGRRSGEVRIDAARAATDVGEGN